MTVAKLKWEPVAWPFEGVFLKFFLPAISLNSMTFSVGSSSFEVLYWICFSCLMFDSKKKLLNFLQNGTGNLILHKTNLSHP